MQNSDWNDTDFPSEQWEPEENGWHFKVLKIIRIINNFVFTENTFHKGEWHKTFSDKNNWKTVSRFSLQEMLKRVSGWKVMIPYGILSL